MNANEMVTVARLADHFEKSLAKEYDPLEVATHAFNKLKRDAPKLWSLLRASDRSDRSLGDWLYDFIGRYKESGMTLKNFAADELERLEAARDVKGSKGRHHTTVKKSPAQLQREIDETLSKPHGRSASSAKRALPTS